MKKKKRKNKSIMLRVLILGVCVYMIATLSGLWNTLNQSRKELEELKATLKEHGKLEENMDYQSVAVAIYQIFQSDKKEDGKKLMEILVKPADKKYNEIVEKKNDGKTNV